MSRSTAQNGDPLYATELYVPTYVYSTLTATLEKKKRGLFVSARRSERGARDAVPLRACTTKGLVAFTVDVKHKQRAVHVITAGAACPSGLG